MDKNIKLGVGERLRGLREKRGLSLQAVSDQLQTHGIGFISKERISDYERDQRATDIWTLNAFAVFYGVSLDYLWYGEGKREVTYRKPSPQLQILRALETLVNYQILHSTGGKTEFYASKRGLLLEFIRRYEEIDTSAAKTNLKVKQIENLENLFQNEMKETHPMVSGSNAVEAIAQFLNQDLEAVYEFKLK